MKKLLAIVLALTMLLGLVACSTNTAPETTTPAAEEPAASEATAPEAETPAAPETTEPEAEAPADSEPASTSDFILSVEPSCEKGDKINKIAYIPMSTTSDYFLAMSEEFVAQFTAAGFYAEYTSPDFDPVRQQEILENYVTQGYDCIVVFPINAASISSAVDAAREQGVIVICQVNQTDACDGWVGTDAYSLGEGAAKLAADWVNKTFTDAADGTVKAALIEIRTDDNNSSLADGCAAVSELSSKVDVVTTVTVTEETEVAAQEAVENLFITNPEIQVIICNTSTLAKGVDAYLTGMSSPVEDPSQIGVFTTGSDYAVYECVSNSPTNSSVIRGISSYAPMSVGAAFLTNIVLNLSNGITGDCNFVADPQYLLNPDNIAEYMAIH